MATALSYRRKARPRPLFQAESGRQATIAELRNPATVAYPTMGTTKKDRTTIVQRLINGQGSVPPMPVVFAISATVERFEKAMKVARPD